MSPLTPSLIFGCILMVVLFGITWRVSCKLDNYGFVDIAWSYGLAILTPLYLALTVGYEPRRWVIAVMAILWSVRLGAHIFIRVSRHHPEEDVRYKVLRQKWPGRLQSAFFYFFEAQAFLVVLLSLPVLFAVRNPAPALSWVEWLGAAVWIIAWVGEMVADRQLKSFRADKANRGKVCDAGLWRYSRHPNYFFESLIWWGFWLFACGSPWGWTTLFAPLLMLHFLLRVTGIPLTEKCSLESKGDAYRAYQRRTSAFIPWFPKHTS